MLLLALETATPDTSAALLRDDELLGEEFVGAGRPTAETLLPAVDTLLTRCEVPLDTVEAFAVSIGPGSFTSLRIGLATVKGFALASERPVVAVPTLTALSRTALAGPGPVIAMLDARRDELYAAAFEDGDLSPSPLLPEGVYSAESLRERLPPVCRLVGAGVEVCGGDLQRALGAGVCCAPEEQRAARASHVAAVGARLLAQGGGVAAWQISPRYVRRAQAEVARTGLRFEGGDGSLPG